MGNYHARCGAGEKPEVVTPEAYLSLFALPEDFCSLLSTMRSREISCNIIIQNLAQIKALFEKTWETILGNSDTLIYLGGNEKSTHQYISETLGKWTIDKKTTGESLGKNGSSSRNYDVLGRELMTPDEVRMMPNEKCLVFIRGQYPVYDYKYKTFEKNEFKEARSYGAYQHKKNINSTINEKESSMMKNVNEIEVLSPEEVDYYKEESINRANISVVEMTQEQLINLDISALDELQMTEDELKELLNDQEYKKILEDSAKEDENLKKECEQLKESIAAFHPKKDADLVKLSFTQRLLSGRYTKEQMEEAEIGLKNGLSEDMILMYFLPSYPVEHMREMRLLAEQML